MTGGEGGSLIARNPLSLCNAGGQTWSHDIFREDVNKVSHQPCVCVCVLHIAGQERNWNYSSFTFLEWPPSFSFSGEREGKKKRKDTASKLQSESRRPRFSARGQKPWMMVDMESHDAQSAGKSRI